MPQAKAHFSTFEGLRLFNYQNGETTASHYNLKLTAMEKTKKDMPAPHPPTDHNPYPYPIQKPNKKGWLYAALAMVAVAVVVTLVCLVVGIYDNHEESLQTPAQTATPTETIVINP